MKKQRKRLKTFLKKSKHRAATSSQKLIYVNKNLLVAAFGISKKSSIFAPETKP